MATTEPFIIGEGNGTLNRHDKVWQSKLSSTMIPGREILRGGGMRSRRIRLFPWPMVRHARRNDPHEDAERAYPGKHLCEAVCSEILIGIGAYPPGVQMSKGTITAKGKA